MRTGEPPKAAAGEVSLEQYNPDWCSATDPSGYRSSVLYCRQSKNVYW